ncbi:hypothetical protein OIU76_009123, partial [Salix suchowensis]
MFHSVSCTTTACTTTACTTLYYQPQHPLVLTHESTHPTSLPYSHVDSDLRVLAAQAEGSVAEPSVAYMGPLPCLDSSG